MKISRLSFGITHLRRQRQRAHLRPGGNFAPSHDLTVHIEAQGYKTVDDTVRKTSSCKGDNVSATFVLER